MLKKAQLLENTDKIRESNRKSVFYQNMVKNHGVETAERWIFVCNPLEADQDQAKGESLKAQARARHKKCCPICNGHLHNSWTQKRYVTGDDGLVIYYGTTLYYCIDCRFEVRKSNHYSLITEDTNPIPLCLEPEKPKKVLPDVAQKSEGTL